MTAITMTNPATTKCLKLVIEAILMVLLIMNFQVEHVVCGDGEREKEREALLEFKSGLVDDYGLLSSWGTSTAHHDCCQWERVYCSNRTGHVIALDLNGADPYAPLEYRRRSLKGELGASLMELQQLTYLNLSWNFFFGSNIPEFFGSLYNLESLDLSFSQFSGQVPTQLGSLSRLKYLSLEDNHLTGSIPHQLGNLSNLQYLMLCDNFFIGTIPSQLGKLSSLQRLCLGQREMHKNYPISYHELEPFKIDDGGQWLSNLTSLTYLDLSGVMNLNHSHNWLQMVAKLPYLRDLRLNDCFLSNHFIHSMGTCSQLNSSSLQVLVLSNNNFTSSMIFPWISKFSPNLVELYLDYSHLEEGPMSDDFATKMTSLEYLNLDGNGLKGKDLEFLANICTMRFLSVEANNMAEELSTVVQNLSAGCARHSLEVLLLVDNQLTGELPDLSIFPSLISLQLGANRLSGKIPEGSRLPSQMEYLAIQSNFLEGGIPKSFGDACNLIYLRLPNNSLSGELPAIIRHLSGCARNSLQELDLTGNQINGTLPDLSIFQSLIQLLLSGNKLKGKISRDGRFPSQLEVLALNSNSLEGVITDSHFANMTRLTYLDLAGNPLALKFSHSWVPPFQLSDGMLLRSCKLGPAFPRWLETQESFHELDISHAEISDLVPEWFWAKLAFPKRMNVRLSDNNLRGTIPNLPIKFTDMGVLDLSSNQFEGSIPPFLRDALVLDLTNNKFSDSHLFFCANGTAEMSSTVNLSNNSLSGPIPYCLSRFKSLFQLDLSHNKFAGKIPTSMGSLPQLRILILRNNSLTGEIPFSLSSCTSLELLDLSENRLSGHIPSWIGRLQQLAIVSLQSNHFFGSLPLNLCYLPYIYILDLSLNNLSGRIPKCFNNFTAMARTTPPTNYDVEYVFNVTGRIRFEFYNLGEILMWKGVQKQFAFKHMILKSIDLSSNQLSGEIPVEIETLLGLISLNLSRNNLTGKIPSKIGSLTSLEFLDLSRNQLHGSIPSSLAHIYRLTMLDVSHNHLSGRIPTGTQLQSFNATSYEDNLDLCGKPLDELCVEAEPPQEPTVEFDEDEHLAFAHAFYMSMGFGFAMGFWGIFGSILVKRSWRHAYFRFLNNLTDNMYVMIAVKVAKYKRWLRG